MTLSFKIFFHIIGCLLFLLIPIILSPQPFLFSETPYNPFIQKDLLLYAIGILFFYASYYFLIPRLYFKREYTLYLFFVTIFALAMLLLPKMYLNLVHPDYYSLLHKKPPKSFLFEARQPLLLFFGVLFASLTICLNDRWRKLHREKLISELSYLKAQINPHFLFNTLNSIYSLAIAKSEHTATAIVTLSGMMRYTINDTSQKYVSLEKEINYLKNYIQLQQLRLGDTAIVNFSIDGDFTDKEIAPLLLIPFVENAFKHGVNPEETSQIDIQVSISDTALYLQVFNLKVPQSVQNHLKTGVGLENGTKQLKLLYPNKHSIKIENKNLSFTVTLKIELS